MSAIDKYSQAIDIGIPVGLGYAAGSMFGYGPHGALAGVAYYFIKGPLMPAIKPSSAEPASPSQQVQDLQSQIADDKKQSVSAMAKSKYDLYKQQIDNAPLLLKAQNPKAEVLFEVPKLNRTPAKNVKPNIPPANNIRVTNTKRPIPFRWNGQPVSTAIKRPFDRRVVARFMNTSSAPGSINQRYKFHTQLNKKW